MRVMLRGEHTEATSVAPGKKVAGEPRSRVGKTNNGKSSERGAALIIAISIMTILLAIGITFFGVTRLEVKTATNVSNKVSVDLISKGVFEIAKHRLNQEFFRNPGVTSPDHPWRSLFSGAAFAQKPWATGGKSLGDKTTNPQIDINLLARAHGSPVYVRFPDGREEVLFQGQRTSSWLFIPRNQIEIVLFDPDVLLVDGDNNLLASVNDTSVINNELAAAGRAERVAYFDENDPGRYPFVLPAVFDDTPGKTHRWPVEIVDTWADVDNDGDGFRDSIWIPIPRDLFFSNDGVDNDLDGMVDETQDDQINNDSDNEAALYPNPQDRPIDAEDFDERIEAGVFVYHAMGPYVDVGDGLVRAGDGLDNDGDGFIDFEDSAANGAPPPYEYDAFDDTVGYFLTAPLPGLIIPIDLNADGVANDLVPLNNAIDAPMVPATVRLPDTITVNVSGGAVILTAANVDVLDNDYDLIVNEFYTYAYVGPNRGRLAPFSYRGIDPGTGQVLFDNTPNSAVMEQAPPSPIPLTYYEDQWRLPGNWVPGDEDRFATARNESYNDINLESILGVGNLTFGPSHWWGSLDVDDRAILQRAVRITHSGEPVCEIVGRAAVHIVDEASKVNLNVAGAYSYNDGFLDKTWNPLTDSYTREDGLVARALNQGISPAEYETRILPETGIVTSAALWGKRMGAPNGIMLPTWAASQTKFLNSAASSADEYDRMSADLIAPGFGVVPTTYAFDVSLPGYGRVDDNGNALLLAMNGIDDDGDGLIDEGLRLPDISEAALFEAKQVLFGLITLADITPVNEPEVFEWLQYATRLGTLEGIDEPGEYQMFSPLRNAIAAADEKNNSIDVDADDAGPLDEPIDEFDELADQVFRTQDSLAIHKLIGPEYLKRVRNIVTVYSSDKNAEIIATDKGLRAINGLDYNYASAQQMAANLFITGDFPRSGAVAHPTVEKQTLVGLKAENYPYGAVPADDPRYNTNGFAEGLRQGDLDVTAPYGQDPANPAANTGGLLWIIDNNGNYLPTTFGRVPGGGLQYGSTLEEWSLASKVGEHAIPHDRQIEVMQTAVDIVDSRDRNHSRTTLTTERRDVVEGSPLLDKTGVRAVVPQITIENPRERVPDAHLLALERIENHLKKALDVSSKSLQSIDTWWAGLVGNTAGPEYAVEERHISYTVTGNDAIKINEIMVRPSRRVEAEAVSQPANLANGIPPFDFFNAMNLGGFNQADVLRQLDPTPFASLPDEIPILPEFFMNRRSSFSIVDPVGGGLDFNATTFGVPADYYPDGGPYRLGEDSGVVVPVGSTVTIETNNGVQSSGQYNIGNIAQFAFFPTFDSLDGQISGLPAGRYYLKIKFGPNTTAAAVKNIQYAIKYVAANDAEPVFPPPPPEPRVSGEHPGVAPSLAGPDIIDDIVTVAKFTPPATLETAMDAYFGVGVADGFWRQIPQNHYASLPGEPPGWAFVRGTRNDLPTDPTLVAALGTERLRYWSDGGGDRLNSELGVPPLATDETFTVSIVEGMALVIAIRKDPNLFVLGPPNDFDLEIDSFEFSQEPDHEYLELVNTSDETVNVGDWRMEVGIPDAPGVPVDPFKSIWRIPSETYVAPQGMLLLVTNKYDSYTRVDATVPVFGLNGANRINTNGIGTVQADLADYEFPDLRQDWSRVSVPPIFGLTGIFNPALTNGDGRPDTNARIYDNTGSVFARFPSSDSQFGPRATFVDYVDNNGDGVSSMNDVNNVVLYEDQDLPYSLPYPIFDSDNVEAESKVISTLDPFLSVYPAALWGSKPFDRIVQLTNDRLYTDPTNPYMLNADVVSLDNIQTVDDVARLLLRGGIFPNYPERDGIDNDGDGAFIKYTDVSDPYSAIYIPGTLDKDYVDNDLDGIIDERGHETVVPGPGTYIAPVPGASEGVDEGAYRATPPNAVFARKYAGDFRASPDPTTDLRMPLRFVNDSAAYPGDTDYQVALGSFLAGGSNYPGFLNVYSSAAPIANLVSDFHFSVPASPVWDVGASDPLNNVRVDLNTSLLQFQHPSGAGTIIARQTLPALVNGQTYLIYVDMPTFNTTAAGIRIELGQSIIPVPLVDENTDRDYRFAVVASNTPGTPQAFTRMARTDVSQEIVIIAMGEITDAAIDSISVFPANAAINGAVGFDPSIVGAPATQIGGDPEAQANDAFAYMGSDRDPPSWKAFVERRWNPGDNVIVSLYDTKGDVVDRVTYRELDVINRTIDDVAPTPYLYDLALSAPDSLNWNLPSLWQEDQMGLDFYRALERKSPLYNGDRFGTTNRWEATDGNYDDWAESMSPMKGIVYTGDFPYRAQPDPSVLAPTAGSANDPYALARFIRPITDYGLAWALDQRHAFWGSPLRMNYQYRISRNPEDLVQVAHLDPAAPFTVNSGAPFTNTYYKQFVQDPRQMLQIPPVYTVRQRFQEYAGMADVQDTFEALRPQDWQYERANVANVASASKGDLLTLPHVINEHIMVNGSVMRQGQHLVDWGSVNFGYAEFPTALGLEPNFDNDYALKSAILARSPISEAITEDSVATQALANMASSDSLTLTVAQADFTPIRPYPEELSPGGVGGCPTCPLGQTLHDQYRWFDADPRTGATEVDPVPPLAWSPVFLFESPLATTGLEQETTYPRFADGGQSGMVNMLDDTMAPAIRPFLFQWSSTFLFGPAGLGGSFSGNMPLTQFQAAPVNVAPRLSLDARAVMYVAKRHELNTLPGVSQDPFRAEAVWSWNAEDGLENGEYILHIGTFIPRLSETLQKADAATTFSTNPNVPGQLLTPFAVHSLSRFDADAPASARMAPKLAIEVITDRVKARGLAPSVNISLAPGDPLAGSSPVELTNPGDANAFYPGLTNPHDWNPPHSYEADADGYIFYGSNAAGDWQPIIVRVRDNFLAIRLRNNGDNNEMAAFSHIVLTPKPHTPGRINVNSANYTLVRNDVRSGLELWNPLLGVPGIIDAGQRSSTANPTTILSEDNPNPLLATDSGVSRPLPSINSFVGTPGWERDPVGSATQLLNAFPRQWSGVLDESLDTFYRNVNFSLARTQLVNMILEGRPEHPDGRYYKNLVELTRDESGFISPNDNFSTIYPLSNNYNEVERFDEVVSRFRRMVNSLTTRSDIFEIIATVEAGYAVDANGDGKFDYRTNTEFIPTAETRARMVYERRTPVDRSDEVVAEN